jgi:hypothetical protein
MEKKQQYLKGDYCEKVIEKYFEGTKEDQKKYGKVIKAKLIANRIKNRWEFRITMIPGSEARKLLGINKKIL